MRWEQARSLVHDASGISDPSRWEWELMDGIMQPSKRIPVIAEVDPSARVSEHRSAIIYKLTAINCETEKLKADFEKGGSTDWSAVGSLAYVASRLDEIMEHLKLN